MSKDITLLEEIAEQDLERRSGGAASVGSWILGDPDIICTWTLECQKNCRQLCGKKPALQDSLTVVYVSLVMLGNSDIKEYYQKQLLIYLIV